MEGSVLFVLPPEHPQPPRGGKGLPSGAKEILKVTLVAIMVTIEGICLLNNNLSLLMQYLSH